MICSKCGAKADSVLCFKCKLKKPLSNSKGLKNKCMIKPSLVLKNRVNAGHIIHVIDPHNYYEVLKENKRINKMFQKAIESDKLKQFFIKQWNTRPHYSEISKEFLGHAFSTIYMHHILPKRNYKEACLDPENIVILSFIEHQQVESDIYRYEYINKKRELLKIKYNIL